MKKQLKALFGALLYKTGFYRSLFWNRAVVVLFHRVDDRLGGDVLSCTVEEFRNYCRFFAKYFHVVTLPELLDRLRQRRDISRCLVITFDDGYLDNYENAARVLKELGLPACFFVVTGFVGTETVAWWDKELPFKCGWMSWDNVRALVADGFDVGAHTASHVDLGVADRITAEVEVRKSQGRLELELDRPIRLFAYPFGRRNQMSETNREVVREAKFDCCLSAFGGDVMPGDDPFYLLRQPISTWYISPYHFGFEAALLRTARPIGR